MFVPANYEIWREAHAKRVKIFQPIKIIASPHAALDGARNQMLLGEGARPSEPV
jgi:hypothetical protein